MKRIVLLISVLASLAVVAYASAATPTYTPYQPSKVIACLRAHHYRAFRTPAELVLLNAPAADMPTNWFEVVVTTKTASGIASAQVTVNMEPNASDNYVILPGNNENGTIVVAKQNVLVYGPALGTDVRPSDGMPVRRTMIYPWMYAPIFACAKAR